VSRDRRRCRAGVDVDRIARLKPMAVVRGVIASNPGSMPGDRGEAIQKTASNARGRPGGRMDCFVAIDDSS
jgi:hypothetical protein